MRFTVIFLALFLLELSAVGQDAPNFAVTDASGTEWSLYDDLLNQGKAVMIEFNTLEVVCSGCADTAPMFEDFYQYWGAGNGSLQMFFISPQDTNNGLTSYTMSSGLSYPKVGAEGGGEEAFDLYCSGDFGNFHSLPVYVIISPEGAVYFNPIEDDEEVLMTVNDILNEIIGGEISTHSSVDKLEMLGGELCYSLTSGATLDLFDLSGRLVYSAELMAGNGRISLPDANILVAHLTTDHEIISQKFYLR